VETNTAAQLVAEAKGRIRNLTVEQVASQIKTGNVVLVDVREPGELAEQGAIAGAVHAPRGMLEFYADPTSPYYRSELDPSAHTIVYCASGSRSALAGDLLKRLGYADVASLEAWKATGRPVVAAERTAQDQRQGAALREPVEA
jgi:rhodanese-related sulfurtransferase